MGVGNSKEWKNVKAQDYLSFLYKLFGHPYIYVNKPQGVAIWLSQNFKNKTLFGQSICFDKIMVKDETVPHTDTNPPHYDFMYVFVKVPISLTDQQKLLQLTDALGYDQFKQSLWVRCDSLDGTIVLLKIITDILTGQNSVASALANGTIATTMKSLTNNDHSTNNININLLKVMYTTVCSNLASLNKSKSEHFMDSPWYAYNGSYISNQPLDIKLGELNNEEYYNTLDEYPMRDNSTNGKTIYDEHEERSQKSFKSPNAYPRAPTGKPTVGNLLDMPQEKKKTEYMIPDKHASCIGACANRYNNMKKKSEHLIPFNAYDLYNKKSEHLIPFNAYDLYSVKKKST